MKSINIYELSRLSGQDIELFQKAEQVMSNKESITNIREHEKEDIFNLVNCLMDCSNNIGIFDDFYYSYTIPQIGKEFDLLKFTEDKVLNLEIKHEKPNEENAILKQLIKNRYYLSHLNKEIISLTFVSSENLFLNLNEKEELEIIGVEEVVDILNSFNHFTIDIENEFGVSHFLVSPLNSPKEFLQQKYFLTDQQYDIKNKIITNCKKASASVDAINGVAGTGKTLLLYDIALELLKLGSVCIIHGGICCDGHEYINNHTNLVILSAKEARSDDLNFDFVLIDESQRIYPSLFSKIINLNTNIIFSFDEKQMLSKDEEVANIPAKITAIPDVNLYKLSDKIRTNKEIAAFIKNMFNLNKKNKNIKYKNIRISYAENLDEALLIIKNYKRLGYAFLNFTPSIKKSAMLDYFEYLQETNTHRAIGQEYDNVVMYIDDNFFYGNDKELWSKVHPNPNFLYDKLLFQGVTRVREKLAIVVISNQDVYSKLLGIIYENDYDNA